MPEPTTDIPADAGLKPGEPDAPARNGDQLVAAAARGEGLAPEESADLLAYYLSNEALPGDEKTLPVTIELGHGDGAREFRCEIHPIEWSEWQDARERATDQKTGEFDGYVLASWNVARALVTPKLGPTVARLQKEQPDKAPPDGAALLRRMFRRQSGALIELSAKVLEISKLQNENNSVREVEAAKN